MSAEEPEITDPNNAYFYGVNIATAMTISAFCAIAWVNTLEMQVRIFMKFKRWTGLYFYALLFASWGCAIHALGFLFLDFKIINQPNALGVLIGVSWWSMVTGQALVLYSRLHLVVRDARRVRWVLTMIIFNAVTMHLPIMLLSQMGYSTRDDAAKWLAVYSIYEKLQMTVFTIQETIISGLYLHEARRILRPGKVFQKKQTSEVLKHLIYVNAFVIFLDAALLGTEYAGLFNIQTVFKAAVYSVKLRFEFVVLNQLMEVVGGRGSGFSSAKGTGQDTFRSQDQGQDNVQLSRVDHRPQFQPDNHTAYVYPGSSGYRPGDQKSEGVMRTTEVQIDSGSAGGRMEQQPPHTMYDDGRVGFAVTTNRSRARASSPTSSEEEFAAKGAGQL